MMQQTAHRHTRAGTVALKVAGLWRYPVKSLRGEQLSQAQVGADGLAGDRQWGIRDERTGRILTARRRPELLHACASYETGVPVVTLPDGQVLAGPGRRTDSALSRWLNASVSLVPAQGRPAGHAEYFADATDDSSQAIEWTMPAGRYVDAAPLLVLTTASLRACAALYPGGVWDVRRFRPNILLDHPAQDWVEDDWVGQQIQLGGALVAPAQPCIRCTMVTRQQHDLDADPDIFRTLARHHHGHLGVWTDVVAGGHLAVGQYATPC